MHVSTSAGSLSVTSNPASYSLIDEFDTPLLDASTIAASGGAFLTVVAALAGAVKRISPKYAGGLMVGLYVGAAGFETLACVIGPGQSAHEDVAITAGVRISLRSLDTNAGTAGDLLAINFLG